MTDLRDARLKQALDHAPDAHMAPDARTRAAIRAMATQAAAPGRPVPWWRRLVGAQSSPQASRMPWNAALATVLLASLVTLIWREEEIPGAKTGDPPIASAPAESPQKADAPQAAPPKPGSRTDSLAKKAEPERTQSRSASAAPAPADARREKGPAPAAAPAPAITQALPAPAPAPAPPQETPPAPSAVPVPPPAMARMAPPAPAAMAPRQRDSRPMAEAARASGAPGVSADANSANSGFAAFDDAALQGWTQARITFQGRTAIVRRAQARNLAAHIRELAQAVSGRTGAMDTVVLQLQLLEGDAVTATLAVGEATARWTQLRGGVERESAGPVDAARVRQLLAEVAPLLP